MRNRLYIAVLIMVAASACSSSNTCYENMDTSFRITMHKMVFDQDKERYVEQDFQTMATIRGLGIDSVLYDSVTDSRFALPLSKLDSQTVFLIDQIKTLDGDTIFVEDTLWIEHVNSLDFVSLECGCASIFDVKSVRYSVNMIDSVKLIDGHVDRTRVNNLKIFVRK